MGAKVHLSRMEWTLMHAAWSHCEHQQDFTVAELMAGLKGRKWNVSTVKTMLERLRCKGALKSLVRGHTCFYRPALSRENVARENIADFLDHALDGTFGPLVAYLADRKGLDEKQVAALEKMLRDSRQK